MDKMQKIFVGLGLIGFVDSIYLAYIKLANQEIICAGIGQCDVVNASKYSEIGGVPIAVLGAGAYLILLALAFLEGREGFVGDNALMGMFGVTLAGVLYSAYLTYIELEVLHAICPYCVLSAIAITIMFIIAIYRLINLPDEELA